MDSTLTLVALIATTEGAANLIASENETEVEDVASTDPVEGE
jgi:hypothetical protein